MRLPLLWHARFFLSLPRIVADFPNARWMFLSLTVRYCAIGELGETLIRMNAAFLRLMDRMEVSPVQGWIRST
ncbi:protein rep, partial [Salmonella enterica]|uniref:protein rep n=1 Tax=Salmonella enterica TaxID=28901 RepID=UPI001CB85E1F